ncbi:Dyp-type peroxidase [Actinomyces minihominis]|uniref:Dyp-type peroxidase n=1 Tax=Actinomyces minihominis TaxID=2002838 RepID=UPI000C08BF18|nr:Dyp-type peroxidase [Actinomyces minihominis]
MSTSVVSKPGPYTDPQDVTGGLTNSAIFVTMTVTDDATPEALREFLNGFEDFVKDVNFRDPAFNTTAVVGVGAQIWPDLFPGVPMPKQLHPMQVVQGDKHTAVSTPGDLFFHIRADTPDLCFELERILLLQLEGMVEVVDEVTGFRYFDARDLLGFVDGTANPVGRKRVRSGIIGDREPEWAGGSYILVQKYLHELTAWDNLTTEQQETIIGRTKVTNIELPDAEGDAQKSHKTLNTIDDAQGVEQDIVRDNMPFGSPAAGEFGTYFISYAGDLQITEEMLRHMFIGNPPGKYDQILDFSTAVTGAVFFALPLDFMEVLPSGNPGVIGDGTTSLP